MKQTKTHPVQYLLMELGYMDPCPNSGVNNKHANHLRSIARAPYVRLLSNYQIGSAKEYEGGGYFRTPVYEYQGVLYTSADPGQNVTSNGSDIVARI